MLITVIMHVFKAPTWMKKKLSKELLSYQDEIIKKVSKHDYKTTFTLLKTIVKNANPYIQLFGHVNLVKYFIATAHFKSAHDEIHLIYQSPISKQNNDLLDYLNLLEISINLGAGDLKKAQININKLNEKWDNTSHDELYLKYLILSLELNLKNNDRQKSLTFLQKLQKLAKHFSEEQELIFKILNLEYNSAYENTGFDAQNWKNLCNELYNHSLEEIALAQNLIFADNFLKKNEFEHLETVITLQKELMHKSSLNLSNDHRVVFRKYYNIEAEQPMRTFGQHFRNNVFELVKSLFSEKDTKDICERALTAITKLLKFDRGFIYIKTPNEPKVIYSINIKEKLLSSPYHNENLCLIFSKMAFETGHLFVKSKNYIHDAFNIIEEQKELLSHLGKRNVLVVPLIRSEHNLEAFIYLDSDDYCNLKNDDDRELMENMISVLAIALEKHIHSSSTEFDFNVTPGKNKDDKQYLEIQKYSLDKFIGISRKRHKLLTDIQKAIESDAYITITGDSGVGKEMVAKTIHYNSKRKDSKFVAINCAALPSELLESKLFGYVKGAFTGANENHDGLFAIAEGGTVFLDEINEMPLSMQVKLLRVLQEKEISPLGSSVTEPIDKDLKQEIINGNFREDLYYRINVLNIKVPNLNERKEDIPLLVDFALKQFAIENNTLQKAVTSQSMEFLVNYNWPGNVRELINVMYNLSIFVESPYIELADIQKRKDLLRAAAKTNFANNKDLHQISQLSTQIDEHELSLAQAKQEFEKLQIQRALEICNGRITSASYHLQMPRPQVSRLMKKYGIDKDMYKE